MLKEEEIWDIFFRVLLFSHPCFANPFDPPAGATLSI